MSDADADPRLSVLILARDEAANLPGCTQSVSWADEVIVVVDAASRDQTLAVARGSAHVDVVAVRTFDDFASQRNAALDLATGDWVFAIDADERATPELAAEIRRVIAIAAGSGPDEQGNDRPTGYRVPIRSVILGRPFGFSGTQHDRPLRLFRRGSGRWIGAVHETVALQGRTGQLVAPLEHCTIPDMQTFLRKVNEYTTLEALNFEREGRRQSAVDLAVRPLWTFLKLYLGKQGFRDGLEGFVFCVVSGLSDLARHWKYRERIRHQIQIRIRAGGAAS
jgi:glycosyltransferase involved in cell wall biosynthesis